MIKNTFEWGGHKKKFSSFAPPESETTSDWAMKDGGGGPPEATNESDTVVEIKRYQSELNDNWQKMTIE